MKSYRALREPITTIEIPFGRNPYGYRINIGHKLIAPLFHEWKLANGLNPRFPPSDENRLRFENFVLEAIATYQQNVEDYFEYQLEYLTRQNKKRSISAKMDRKQKLTIKFYHENRSEVNDKTK